METTKTIDVKLLQKRLFNITDGIVPPEEVKNNFLYIMAIRMGRKHPVYTAFSKIVDSKEEQFELLLASEKNKLKKDFDLFCKMVLKSFFQQEKEKSLWSNYFKELEHCSKERSNLFDFTAVKRGFTELRDMEKNISDYILHSVPHLPSVTYRQLLTAWLIHPDLIFFPEKADEIIKLFEKRKLTL